MPVTNLTGKRLQIWKTGLAQLPDLPELQIQGRNGEELATDEAAVWKRVLDYRVAQWQQPETILETHAGLGIGTALYRHACPSAIIHSLHNWQQQLSDKLYHLIDIDPFGQPWDTLAATLPHLRQGGILMLSNGEALAVWRNLRKQQRYPTHNYGKQMPHWITEEYLPRLEQTTKLQVKFFYAFPSSVRVVLSTTQIPTELWNNCPRWMWWLAKYANVTQMKLWETL
jgi:hypothetical protein